MNVECIIWVHRIFSISLCTSVSSYMHLFTKLVYMFFCTSSHIAILHLVELIQISCSIAVL